MPVAVVALAFYLTPPWPNILSAASAPAVVDTACPGYIGNSQLACHLCGRTFPNQRKQLFTRRLTISQWIETFMTELLIAH